MLASSTIQVNAYLQEPAQNFEELKNPIDYWRKYQNCELKEVALKYLIVVATSVPSERLGSAAGGTVNERRTNLLPEHVNELVFLNKNSFLLDVK